MATSINVKMAKTNSTPMFSYSKPYPFQASLPAFKNTVWVTLSLLSSEESGFNFRIGVCTKSNYSNRRIEAGLGRIFRSAICSFTFSIHQGGQPYCETRQDFRIFRDPLLDPFGMRGRWGIQVIPGFPIRELSESAVIIIIIYLYWNVVREIYWLNIGKRAVLVKPDQTVFIGYEFQLSIKYVYFENRRIIYGF